ncbi:MULTISPECIES: crotonase/enoyl-CoA hydratase family protein [Neisseria]|uniref:Enoyl-CoA hydratase n=1 Tax=Neisseria dumasiana TaxID=1931275 RepID=A0ABX3WNJ5_9NEIS|nr:MULTISPECIES: crotonase/enoyl-CoA hydratase family protein [Neisseria]KPN73461.1 enoyl-CoA hydratase [Neisseria sp. 74A18]OSI16658.1 enoyl-CoA hydratase [Neisseria dumasiana]OSI36427.1 enoyl-CoA hydratase [Neisseria dumasiana]UOO83968.1 enoyl-CoA hydratase-related protein [Neisseria dumasiana]
MNNRYQHMCVTYDEKYKADWVEMAAKPLPCFTSTLLKSLLAYFDDVRAEMKRNGDKYRYIVGTSAITGVYNLGGDLQLFSQAIRNRDRDTLMAYATDCIDVLYAVMTHLGCEELTTINCVAGDALGGGFEGALAGNVLVAEKGSRMGLPEVMFNLFPGMGAYSMLLRKVGAGMAEEIIMSGKIYTAEQLFEMGVVDILTEKGCGRDAVLQYMEKVEKTPNSYRAMRKVKDYCNPVSYKELIDITTIWVDAALKLTERDLHVMSHLLHRQANKFVKVKN